MATKRQKRRRLHRIRKRLQDTFQGLPDRFPGGEKTRLLLRRVYRRVTAAIRRLTRAIRRRKRQNAVPGIEDGGWHPDAKRVPYDNAGVFDAGAGMKLVWHTTEGSGLPRYSGSAPHFTLDPQSGALYQHIPINRVAMALRNQSGWPETNRAGAIQVECIGFASETPNWSDGDYAELARLARWIERHAGVPRECSVAFIGTGRVNHISSTRWVNYAGHIGHQHVPENTHWDPGRLKIEKVL